MYIPLWVWAATIAGLLVLVVIDFLVGRKPHAVSLREAALWGVFWVLAAGVFCAGLWWFGGSLFISKTDQYWAAIQSSEDSSNPITVRMNTSVAECRVPS